MLSIQWNNLKKQNSLKIVQHHHEGNKLHKMFRVETGLGGDCWWTWEAWSGAEVEGPGAEGPGRAGAAVDTPPGPSPPAAGARQREDAAEAGWLLCRAARGHDEGELFPGSLSSPIRGNGRQSSLHGRPPFTPSSQILSGGCVWGTRLSALRASIIGQCASQAWPARSQAGPPPRPGPHPRCLQAGRYCPSASHTAWCDFHGYWIDSFFKSIQFCFFCKKNY